MTSVDVILIAVSIGRATASGNDDRYKDNVSSELIVTMARSNFTASCE
eukprot:CAMPEP_0169404630 /NCGR_PEP_ID=MMETSP1017-20121227/56493_1 /TAXON_ID=342587 /ORGANISM="Karlodinium micrum, Strain CCMP2283" /LENGTH=47 /DNA_ID= /DNA_START= /DNA_END= /DNA_ORIENTATION=